MNSLKKCRISFLLRRRKLSRNTGTSGRDNFFTNSSGRDNFFQVNNIIDIPGQETIFTTEISCQNVKFYHERPKKANFTP
jgi:hypothetical protein